MNTKEVYINLISDEKAVAVLMMNLKGPKNKPSNLLDVADACRHLIKKWGIAEVSKYFHTSEYMLRQIDKINEIKKDPVLKKLINDGTLRIEASYQLWRLDQSKRSQVAKIIKDMTSDEVRSFAYFLHKHDKLSVVECKKLFDETKPEKIRILAIPLNSKTFDDLQNSANKSKMKIHDFALKIVENYLYEKSH